jgi:hypothetical protein
MEKSKSQIIIKLIRQVYSLVDEVYHLKDKVSDLEKHKVDNPDSYLLTGLNDALVKENKSLSNTIENLRNELKILKNGKK